MKQGKLRVLHWLQTLLTMLLLAGLLAGCGPTKAAPDPGTAGQTESAAVTESSAAETPAAQIAEDGSYTTKDEVALYIHTYGHLPSNFITKKEAEALGWDSKKGNLWDVAPGKSIGGDYFGNYEGKLPEEKGLQYHECDINYGGGHRGAERIIYSNRGQIYYTGDHYQTFTLLYDGS